MGRRKIALITAVWKRHELTDLVLQRFKKIKEEIKGMIRRFLEEGLIDSFGNFVNTTSSGSKIVSIDWLKKQILKLYTLWDPMTG